MTAGRGISTRVVTSDGWAVTEAIVTVTDLTGQQVARAVADADGQVGTEPVAPGTYTVIFTAPGFSPVARTAIVTPHGADLGTVKVARVGGDNLPTPGKWTIDPAHSAILVSTRHIGLSTISGRFTSFAGTVEIGDPVERSTVVAVIEADSIDTANKMRDDHLRSGDFLDVDNYATITFTGTGLTAKGSDRWVLAGDLTLRDVTKPVELELAYLGVRTDPWGNQRVGVRATVELHRNDFAITYNQVLAAGIDAVGTTLRVELDIQAVAGDSLPTL